MKHSLNVTLICVAALIGVSGCNDVQDAQGDFLDRKKIEMLRQSDGPVPLADLLLAPDRVSTVCELVPYTEQLNHHPELEIEISQADVLPIPEHLWVFAFFSSSNEYLGYEKIRRHYGEIRHINKRDAADYHCSSVVGGKMMIRDGIEYVDIGLVKNK